MQTLGQQFTRKMKSRITPTKFTHIAQDVANHMIEVAQTNTRKGKTVRGGNYDSRYARSTKKRKKKTDPVNLRDKDLSVERMRATTSGNKAGVRGEERLRKHNEGIRYKNVGFKRRQMFPENYAQVPQSLMNFMKQEIEKVLKGSYDK